MIGLARLGLRNSAEFLHGGSTPDTKPKPEPRDPGSVSKALAGVGTAIYASPEQLEGLNSTYESDLFSVGVIMFELYHKPFKSQMDR